VVIETTSGPGVGKTFIREYDSEADQDDGKNDSHFPAGRFRNDETKICIRYDGKESWKVYNPKTSKQYETCVECKLSDKDEVPFPVDKEGKKYCKNCQKDTKWTVQPIDLKNRINQRIDKKHLILRYNNPKTGKHFETIYVLIRRGVQLFNGEQLLTIDRVDDTIGNTLVEVDEHGEIARRSLNKDMKNSPKLPEIYDVRGNQITLKGMPILFTKQ
jgi:hypothetical protein